MLAYMAPLTGNVAVPTHEAAIFCYEPAKFGAADLWSIRSQQNGLSAISACFQKISRTWLKENQ
jgi:hypothetical protein